MEKGTTELVFILDKSGSMSGMEQDTIGGFNSMIEKQKQLDGKVYVSTVLFSNDSEVLHDRQSLDEIKPLTTSDYVVGGCTALLDALGSAIHHIGNVHKYAREEDVPERTVFVITTDGMENASRSYSAEQVKSMVRRQQEKYGWEFLFVAANIDAVETARNIGIKRERAANYDVAESRSMYSEVANTLYSYRECGVIDADWADNIEDKKKANEAKRRSN